MTTQKAKKVTVVKAQAKSARTKATATKSTPARKSAPSKNEVFAKLSTFPNKHGEDRPCVITPYLEKDSFTVLANYARANKGTYMKKDKHGGSWHFSKDADAQEFLRYANEQFAKGKLVVGEKETKPKAKKTSAKSGAKTYTQDEVDDIVDKAVEKALAKALKSIKRQSRTD